MTRELVAMGYGKRFPERDILQLLKNYQHSSKGITSASVERLEIKMAARETELLQRATRRIEKAMSLEGLGADQVVTGGSSVPKRATRVGGANDR